MSQNNVCTTVLLTFKAICVYIHEQKKDKKPHPGLLKGIISAEELDSMVDKSVICTIYSAWLCMARIFHCDNLFICYLYNKQWISKQQQKIKTSKELGCKEKWAWRKEKWSLWRESKEWPRINNVKLKVLKNKNKRELRIVNETWFWSLY